MSEKEIVLKAETLELSKKILDNVEIDSKTGKGVEKENCFLQNLPATVTEEAVKDLEDYRTTYSSAATHAFGSLSIQALEKNADLSKTEIDLSFGVKDKLELSFDRSRSYPNTIAGNGEKIVKFGVVTAGVTMAATHNAGELKKVKNLLGQLAFDALNK